MQILNERALDSVIKAMQLLLQFEHNMYVLITAMF